LSTSSWHWAQPQGYQISCFDNELIDFFGK
jgi:hypothetical protein